MKYTVTIHDCRIEGVPEHEDFTGRMVFIFDGCMVSGWPLLEVDADGLHYWEANSDVGRTVKFAGVTHWVELPAPVCEML